VPLHAIITYTTIALLMSLVLEIDGTRLIRDRVREGSIATDLMKPINLPLYFFSDGFGQNAAARDADRPGARARTLHRPYRRAAAAGADRVRLQASHWVTS